jgi:hypothetical protein
VVIIPLLVIAHVGIFLSLGIVFLNFPLILLFLDWDALTHWKSDGYSAREAHVSRTH